MLNKTDELGKVEDWRWKLLICVAILLIAVGLHKRHERGAETVRNVSVQTETWLGIKLHWEKEGQFGEGIYSHGVEEISLATKVMAEGAVEESLVEPRLAILTYRPLDLNRIDFETLRVLKGVGPKMAAAIIDCRQNHGPFRRIEDLLEVKGVGPAKFKVLSRSLSVKTVGNS